MRPTSTSLLAYCRPGFESECAQELASAGERLGVIGFARTTRGSGFVEYVLPDSSSQQAFSAGVQLANLTFARQLLRVIERIDDLPAKDRLGLLMPVVRSTARRFVDAWIESPDSDAARELAGLCRSLNNALVAAMKRESLIDAASQWRLHVCLVDAQTAFVCEALFAHAAPWPGGIPRLRFPAAAPSRSTLKLEEAFLTLLDEDERSRWLQAGMCGVDLGAAPGGWTWQLVRRAMRVIAVDNGYRPPNTVEWLVWDMVE